MRCLPKFNDGPEDLCKLQIRFFEGYFGITPLCVFAVDSLIQLVAETYSAECSLEDVENRSGCG